jgi:hypothetical protein
MRQRVSEGSAPRPVSRSSGGSRPDCTGSLRLSRTLDREVARQQAKLEHRAVIIAAGKKPMGAPPVPVEEHSSVIRARRAVESRIGRRGRQHQPGLEPAITGQGAAEDPSRALPTPPPA